MLLVLFGFGMFAFGGFMFFKPMAFANGISEFSGKPWFHGFEITSRFIVGLLFVWQSNDSTYPWLFLGLGIVLCFTGTFLVLVGSSRHKRIAILTSKIGKWFRPIGIFALSAGSALMYLGFFWVRRITNRCRRKRSLLGQKHAGCPRFAR